MTCREKSGWGNATPNRIYTCRTLVLGKVGGPSARPVFFLGILLQGCWQTPCSPQIACSCEKEVRTLPSIGMRAHNRLEPRSSLRKVSHRMDDVCNSDQEHVSRLLLPRPKDLVGMIARSLRSIASLERPCRRGWWRSLVRIHRASSQYQQPLLVADGREKASGERCER